ncbi:MAG: TrmH family RNA methyltransferase [Rhodothermales bacterium]|nr:TrmH family RNA methyltransferase [Rhodothermales bacterium]
MRKLKHQEIRRLTTTGFDESSKHPISILIDNVRSAYNVGSILRTSDAARVEHVYLTGISPPPSHKLVHKTALGAQETVSTSTVTDPAGLIQELREKGYTIAALELTDTPFAVSDITPDHFPMLLIVGNELSGVDDELIGDADLAIEIPQYGTKQSLNVAVAYGIAIFGLVDQYRSNQQSV